MKEAKHSLIVAIAEQGHTSFVFAPACGVPKPSRRVVSPELVALASEESMGTLTRISRLTALRKHLLWARNVIPRLSTKLSPVCG